MQKKIVTLLLVSTLSLLAYTDSDMDGVDDKNDLCPNTPFSDLVNSDGCSTKSLVNPHKFNIVLGISFSQSKYSDTDTTTQNAQINYYYKNFSAQISSSYYNTESTTYTDNGTNDSYLGVSYKFSPIKKLYLRAGLGVIMPTYDTSLNNNNPDYTSSLSLSYMPKNINMFARYSYTLINDDDTILVYDDGSSIEVNYQNTSSYNLGAGIYPSPKSYLSFSYNSSESIYEGADNIETLSCSLFYNINKKVFTSLAYAYGLSDSASDNYLSLRVGYYF